MNQPPAKLSLSLTIGVAVAFFLSLVPFLSGMCLHLCVAAYVMVRHYCSANDVGVTMPKAFRISFLGTGIGTLLSQFYFGVNYYIANGKEITPYKEQVLKMMTEMDRGSGQFSDVIAQLSAEGADGIWIASMLIGSVFGGLLASLIGAAIGGSMAAAHVKRWRERE